MQGEGILQTIAEVSIALAGFTGVVVVFGRRPDEDEGGIRAHAFKGMLASSLQAVLFSILPFLLFEAGLYEPGLWRVGSGFMVLGLLAGATVDVRYVRRSDSSQWTAFDRIFRVLIPAFGAAAIVAQCLNAFGAVERAFAPYLGGLVFFLFFSSIMFVRLVTVSERAPRRDDERAARDAAREGRDAADL